MSSHPGTTRATAHVTPWLREVLLPSDLAALPAPAVPDDDAIDPWDPPDLRLLRASVPVLATSRA
ncbi:hypothetical protein [Cellulomonas sp.]|uniref:hypothetical protein n=1 Tax=Cellulomonas sp. TaxID=40001 RepID=UPI001B1ABC8E|nr:hypothetical protein [Cellulomonas sp.]MBO9553813.1 hypothetical protein [Cellulomonas sp.]